MIVLSVFSDNVFAYTGNIENYDDLCAFMQDGTNDYGHIYDTSNFNWPTGNVVIRANGRKRIDLQVSSWTIPENVKILGLSLEYNGFSTPDHLIINGVWDTYNSDDVASSIGLPGMDITLGDNAVVCGRVDITDSTLKLGKNSKMHLHCMYAQNAVIEGNGGIIRGDSISVTADGVEHSNLTISGTSVTIDGIMLHTSTSLTVDADRLFIGDELSGWGNATVNSGSELILIRQGRIDAPTTVKSGASVVMSDGIMDCNLTTESNSNVYINGWVSGANITGYGTVYTANASKCPELEDTLTVIGNGCSYNSRKDYYAYNEMVHDKPCSDCGMFDSYDGQSHSFNIPLELSFGSKLYSCKTCPYFYLLRSGISETIDGITMFLQNGALTIVGTGELENAYEFFMIGDYREGITIINIGEGITHMGSIGGMPRLKTVRFPKSLKSLGDMVLYDCQSLKSVTIPSGITQIPNNAFVACKNLESITLPKTLTSIGDGAFDGCKSLKKLYYRGNNWGSVSIGAKNSYLQSAAISSGYASTVTQYTPNLTTSVSSFNVDIPEEVERTKTVTVMLALYNNGSLMSVHPTEVEVSNNTAVIDNVNYGNATEVKVFVSDDMDNINFITDNENIAMK